MHPRSSASAAANPNVSTGLFTTAVSQRSIRSKTTPCGVPGKKVKPGTGLHACSHSARSGPSPHISNVSLGKCFTWVSQAAKSDGCPLTEPMLSPKCPKRWALPAVRFRETGRGRGFPNEAIGREIPASRSARARASEGTAMPSAHWKSPFIANRYAADFSENFRIHADRCSTTKTGIPCFFAQNTAGSASGLGMCSTNASTGSCIVFKTWSFHCSPLQPPGESIRMPFHGPLGRGAVPFFAVPRT